jgi:diguanylate cyclase (GGDEF)-like protein
LVTRFRVTWFRVTWSPWTRGRRDDLIATTGWVTQQLADFLALLTAAPDQQTAADEALTSLAVSFEADACAFLRKGRVTSSFGWAAHTSDAYLLAATNNERTGIDVPGFGWRETIAIAVDRDAGTTLLLARAHERFTADEVGLLRAMARVLALALRLLGLVATERRQVEENRGLVVSLRERQALLERLAQIQRKISVRDTLQHVFDAITAGAAELLDGEVVGLRLVDESDPTQMVLVSSMGVTSELEAEFRRISIHTGVGGRAIVEGRVCLAENYQEWGSAVAEFSHNGLHSAMAAPIDLEGRTVGSLSVASSRHGRTYSEHERDILVAFAEHAGLALNDSRTVQAKNRALTDALHQAMHDDLTGLPNRACFYDRTDQALRQGARDRTSTAVLLFDLDQFKEINDTLGHKYGDRVLCEIGPRIRRGLRNADTLARLGGDEFCVLLPHTKSLGAAVEVAERIMAILEEPFDLDGMTLAVEASCGIAIAPTDGESADLLLQRSDVAMYVAKGSHTRVVTYNEQLNVNTPARMSLLGELRNAIARDQFVLYYQPKASLSSGQIQGVEALIRWQHPTLGLVPPDQFIPLAEHTGLIKPLTTWVLDTALCQLGLWRDQTDAQLTTELSMAVNVSARSLLDDAFPNEVVSALERWSIPAHLLEVEITESAMMADPQRAHRLLTELSAPGVKVSIDDFGTGYSSLAYLKNLPVDQLKIDRSFISNMHDDPNDAIIVRSVIDLGHNLGLETVAEGIEDLETWQQLTALGCDSAQGYFLARPMPPAEFGVWLRERDTGNGHAASA